MKTALVIGSRGGIGNAICQDLLRFNWRVVGADLEGFGSHNDIESESYTSLNLDILDHSAVKRCAEFMEAEGISIDSMIYAAGTYDHFPLAEAEAGRLRSIIDVNVAGVNEMVSGFLHLFDKSDGRIVIISSETAMTSLPFQVYGVSKRMLEVYADALRQEMDFLGVRVILVRPGAHSTRLLDKSRDLLDAFPATSLFHGPLSVARDKGQAIIDKGAADPSAVGKVVVSALSTARPRHIYHVNVSGRFYAMSVMPRRIKEFILKRVLGARHS